MHRVVFGFHAEDVTPQQARRLYDAWLRGAVRGSKLGLLVGTPIIIIALILSH